MSDVAPRRIQERLRTDRPVWVISDLHLGDGTQNDAFFGKDRHLLAFMERVESAGAVLVVNGDALDFHQAFGFARILKAHGQVLAAMSRLGEQGRLYYVIGNHDYDIAVFSELLRFRVCHQLVVGPAAPGPDRVLIRHGYEYDPYITDMLDQGQWHTIVHHLVERWLGTWIRIPMAEFYTVPNRVLFWLGHKVGLGAWAWHLLGRRFGHDDWGLETLAHLDLWCWSNMGDSMGIFRPAFHDAQRGPYEVVVCGHSHLPGVVERDGRVYANSGSWTFASTWYLTLQVPPSDAPVAVTCEDWATGRAVTDELYRPMLDGSMYERDFFQWWRENYMGFLRFREGEERRGRSRGWELWQREQAPLDGPHRPSAPTDPTSPTQAPP